MICLQYRLLYLYNYYVSIIINIIISIYYYIIVPPVVKMQWQIDYK